jgi:hypothetical protein
MLVACAAAQTLCMANTMCAFEGYDEGYHEEG